MPKRIMITFMSGAEDGREVLLHSTTVSIGREERNEVVVPFDSRISRRHALVELRGDRLYLRDLGSRNGTYLEDGTRIVEVTAIPSGALFRLGRTWLKVNLVD